MPEKNHFTTRRGFIAASGFGGISLYGLWAAYGAAPGPLALLGLDHAHAPSTGHAEHGAPAPEAAPVAAGGHAGHGAAAAGGPSAEEFSRLTAEFAERYRMPDGSVYPRRLPSMDMAAMDPHAGHDMTSTAPADHTMPEQPDPHAGHGGVHASPVVAPASHTGHGNAAPLPNKGQPIDVLMTAGKWYYLPNALRLDAGQAYRFKMMAVDIAHGASIQLGKAGRMVRLQPGRITETAITFQKPGRYLVYCTVYCGEAHQLMQATIEVV